jgi:hypothetical protein
MSQRPQQLSFGGVQQICLQVLPLPPVGRLVTLSQMLEIVDRWFDNMLVVQERLRVLNRTIFLTVNMVLLANMVVPINTFSKKTVRPRSGVWRRLAG